MIVSVGTCWFELVVKPLSRVSTRFRCRNPFFLELPPHNAGLSILGTSQLPSPLMNSVTQLDLYMKLTTFLFKLNCSLSHQTPVN